MTLTSYRLALMEREINVFLAPHLRAGPGVVAGKRGLG